MKCSIAILLIVNNFVVFSQFQHEVLYFIGCFVNGTPEVEFEFDGEEMLYYDFQKDKPVLTAPSFVHADPSSTWLGLSILNSPLKEKKLCSDMAQLFQIREKLSAEAKDPPETIVYTARQVEEGVRNSLICFVNYFYPPSINISWTKNGHPVTEGVSLSRYYPNTDQTFRQFSMLMFMPSEGDIYSCSVQHLALDSPKTRIWEVEFTKEDESSGPDIFCGAGLALGLIGITTGIFFFVKGYYKS